MAEQRKRSTVRHTRAIQRDRTKRPASVPADEAVEQRLTDIFHPATLAQVGYFHQLGLRERTLNLPVMMALVLSMIWRQISGVCELVRMIQTESLLWTTSRKVSQQAMSERLNSLPAELFVKVLTRVLAVLARAQQSPPPVVTSYYYFNGQRVAMRNSSGVFWLHGDHLGSASLTTNSTGGVVGQMRYGPYGNERWASGSMPSDRRFTGQRAENGVGLYDYGARMPKRSVGARSWRGSPDAANPQALNRYAYGYVRHNPMGYVDPTGACSRCAVRFW